MRILLLSRVSSHITLFVRKVDSHIYGVIDDLENVFHIFKTHFDHSTLKLYFSHIGYRKTIYMSYPERVIQGVNCRYEKVKKRGNNGPYSVKWRYVRFSCFATQ